MCDFGHKKITDKARAESQDLMPLVLFWWMMWQQTNTGKYNVGTSLVAGVGLSFQVAHYFCCKLKKAYLLLIILLLPLLLLFILFIIVILYYFMFIILSMTSYWLCCNFAKLVSESLCKVSKA